MRSKLYLAIENSLTGILVKDSTVTVRDRFTNDLATIYLDETGPTTIPNPITVTDGRVDGWIDDGSWKFTVQRVNYADETAYFEIINAQDYKDFVASSGGVPLYVQDTAPVASGSYMWFDTGPGFTLWIEDGV